MMNSIDFQSLKMYFNWVLGLILVISSLEKQRQNSESSLSCIADFIRKIESILVRPGSKQMCTVLAVLGEEVWNSRQAHIMRPHLGEEKNQDEFTLICCKVYRLKSAETIFMYVFRSGSYPNISS